ncbi:hypothetical protein BpHYR1_018113 [Brachionus plicatilis]|uniref:Uncharacterized protein n=1 Tax=Brachionus plicatilis TaxID=10195 RepID=A0A3M7PM40_BRAPC|nr:hypothetical protein BpHYR1_018113 [Brachionus plicatilis]
MLAGSTFNCEISYKTYNTKNSAKLHFLQAFTAGETQIVTLSYIYRIFAIRSKLIFATTRKCVLQNYSLFRMFPKRYLFNHNFLMVAMEQKSSPCYKTRRLGGILLSIIKGNIN